MAISNRTLKAGTRLEARYKGEAHIVEVIDTPEGTRYRNVASNVQFKSLSAAGVAIMGGIQCNGWRFFSLQGQEPAATSTPAPKAAAKTRATKGGNGASKDAERATLPPRLPKAPRAHKLLTRTPNQRGVTAGHMRFFCDACMRSFEASLIEGTPTECPQGHKSDDPELTAPVQETPAAS